MMSATGFFNILICILLMTLLGRIYPTIVPMAEHPSEAVLTLQMELAWCSGSVMDCHTTTRGSIPVGKGVSTELHVLRKAQ